MGTVWRAHDELLDRPVAAKVLNVVFGHHSEDQNRRERSLREARATARINHPNVVRVYDYVEDDDRLWIVMELLAARSLDAVLDEDGPLTPQDAAAIGVQIARALRVVHEHGVLHRDVKPGNVMIEADGHAVLTDFGIAALEGSTGLTGTGAIVGSPEFMAPERIESDSPGPASDLWSLGVTLCAAVTGSSPFRRSTPVATLAAIVIAEPEVPDATGPLEPLVRALFARDPEARPDAAAVMAGLQTVLDAEARRHSNDPTREVVALAADAPTWQLEPGAVAGGAAPEAAASGTAAPAQAPELDESAGPGAPGDGTQDLRTVLNPAAQQAPAAPRGEDATASLLMPAARPPVGPPPGQVTEELPRVPAPPPRDEVPVTLSPMPGDTTPATVLPGTATPTREVGPPAARPWWRKPVVVGPSAAAVVAAIVIGAVLASGGGDDDKAKNQAQTGSSVSASQDPTDGAGPSASAGPPTSAPATQAPKAPVYPAEATVVAAAPIPVATADEKRFAWPVPQGWRRNEQDGVVRYDAPSPPSMLAARTAFKQTDDLLEQWRPQEQRSVAVFSGYKLIRFEERTIRGNPGVVWEYTWTEGGDELHAVLTAFIENGLYVEVDVRSNAANWERDQALFFWALQNLKLAGG
ncbi:protein kinase [Yinghuangia sp. KLBMP8922]|uniref:non-specific serine/threonine protein kinase n=2 Tax=Yinghuangia soli TaxID=2908204 RepID=A0AA41U195_9ACTN|nr:protein kinase [Yinghuangia soli]